MTYIVVIVYTNGTEAHTTVGGAGSPAAALETAWRERMGVPIKEIRIIPVPGGVRW